MSVLIVGPRFAIRKKEHERVTYQKRLFAFVFTFRRYSEVLGWGTKYIKSSKRNQKAMSNASLARYVLRFCKLLAGIGRYCVGELNQRGNTKTST